MSASTSSSPTPVPRALSGAELEHFNSIPWAKSILQTSLQPSSSSSSNNNNNDNNDKSGGDGGDYVAIETPVRTPKETDEDGFLAGTLATPETIPFMVTLRRRNLVQSSSLPPEPPITNPKSARGATTTTTTPSRPPDTITLVLLSAPGISGHVSTAHGGVIATLFDEAMHLAVEAYLPSSSSTASSPTTSTLDTHEPDKTYTVQLNVRYRKPVYAPGLLVIRSWCVAQAGRKYWSLAHAVQEEQDDGKGGHLETVRAEASSLWVVTRDEKL